MSLGTRTEERDVRRGISRSDTSHDGPSVVGSFDASPLDEAWTAASWAAGWIRDVLRTDADVRIHMIDLHGELRIVWRDDRGVGSTTSTHLKRLEAIRSGQSLYEEHAVDPRVGSGLFPLESSDGAVGLMEVVAPADVLPSSSDRIQGIADRLAGWIFTMSEREQIRRQLGSLEREAALQRQLMRAASPEVAARIAARSLSEESSVPVCIWWAERDGPLALSASYGLSEELERTVRERLDPLPGWTDLMAKDRSGIRRRFASIVGADHVAAHAVRGALMVAASGDADVRRRLRTVGSLLDIVLPLLAASGREQRRDTQVDLGIAWTAHELRGPLLGVKAALETLVRRDDSGDRLLRQTLCEVARLANDAEGMLRWALGSRDLDRSPADMRELVESTVQPFRTSTGRRIDITADGSVNANVDATQFRAVVANLVRNAVAYSDPDRAIAVRIENHGSSLELSVRDEGPGIPPVERESIFAAFVRGEAGSRRPSGSGLGLFITRRVVEAHGGRVWVDAGSPGAVFHVLLPIEERRLQRSAS